MTERLLSFLFLGILLALGYHLAIDLAYEHFFPASRLYQIYWYIPLVLVPTVFLAGLAWALGFFRRTNNRWGDITALLMLMAIVVLTIGAPYNCWNGCF